VRQAYLYWSRTTKQIRTSGLHTGSDVPWSTLEAVPNIGSLYAHSTVCSPGPTYLSLQRQQGEPFTYSTALAEGKYTLLTIATGADVRVQQMLMPQTSNVFIANDTWAHPSLTDPANNPAPVLRSIGVSATQASVEGCLREACGLDRPAGRYVAQRAIGYIVCLRLQAARLAG